MSCECTYGICCRPCWDQAKIEDPCNQAGCNMPRLHDGPHGFWVPGMSTRPISSDKQTELQRLRARVATLEAASVARDRALEQQDFAGCLSEEQRKELVDIIAEARFDDWDCRECAEAASEYRHLRTCKTARWLRILGGPEEVQRQVDAAWEAALRDITREHKLGRATTSIDSTNAWLKKTYGTSTPLDD